MTPRIASEALELGKSVLRAEASALALVAGRLDESFPAAVELLQEPLGMMPQIMNPWASVEGGDVGPQAQAVAGAAACLSGKLA